MFARLEGKHATIDDPVVVKERDMVVASVEHEKALGQATWREVFTEGKNRNISRVLLGAGPYMFVIPLSSHLCTLLMKPGSINGQA